MTIFCSHILFPQVKKIEKNTILEIQVYGYPDLSKTLVVREDGIIDHPLVAGIPIDGLSLNEFREVLKAQAAKYTGEAPIITVRFAQSVIVPVIVLGQVNKPGEYAVPRNGTVQGAIGEAGGLTPRARIDQIRLIRRKGEKKETITVDLGKFFIHGDPEILPKLEEGDIIVVPGLHGSSDVKVIGAVRLPGRYTLFEGADLLDVLYMAGGPLKSASLGRIRLISSGTGKREEQQVNMKKILKQDTDATLPVVHPGDVVYVPEKINWFQIFRDLVSLTSIIVVILYQSGVIERS